MKILYVASLAPEKVSLAIEREIMDLQQSLFESSFDGAHVVCLPDVLMESLPLILSRHKPDVLHIAVHGDKAGLWFAREPFRGEQERQVVEVNGDTLAAMFDPTSPPKLVFLNACESGPIAKSLSKHGILAIGTSAPIVDQTAIAVARLMYSRLFEGLPVLAAYQAMNSFVNAYQADGIEMELAEPSEGSARLVLFSKPTIIARLAPDTNLESGLAIKCRIGVKDPPVETSQVIFFTADQSFVDERPDESLEEKLTEGIRDNPRKNEIWTDTNWKPVGNFRVAACGISGSGKTFSTSSMLVPALDHYVATHTCSKRYLEAWKKARVALLDNESAGHMNDWP
jgi:hypothetical protein